MSTQTLNADALRQAVVREYGQVAINPGDEFPFPVGRAFAESLGYQPRILDTLPASAVESFTGISNPLDFADLKLGETVLDLGCGAGVDTILMARQVGPAGRVIGVDLAPEMVNKARTNAANQGLSQVDIRLAPAEKLPLDDDSVDAVVVNGIFNLCANKEVVATEIWRILKPGGRLLVSEIVLQMPDEESDVSHACSLGDASSPEEALAKWFSWLAGAWPERSFRKMLAASGFVSVETLNYMPNKRTHGTNTIVADMRALKAPQSIRSRQD